MVPKKIIPLPTKVLIRLCYQSLYDLQDSDGVQKNTQNWFYQINVHFVKFSSFLYIRVIKFIILVYFRIVNI